MIADCNDPACLDARGDIPRPLQMSNSGGSAGAAGTGNTPGGTLAGNVLDVPLEDLAPAASVGGGVEVRAPSAAANADAITSAVGVGGMFRLDGIRQNTVVWVGVGAFATPPAGPFIDTIQAIDSTRSDFVDLLVIRRDVMSKLAAGFVTNPVELDPASAHIIVRFVDERRAPVPGVTVTFPEVISVAYDIGDTYIDTAEATSLRGVAVLMNLAAPRYPGGPTSIVAAVGDEELTANLLIAQGAVTVVTAVIPDP